LRRGYSPEEAQDLTQDFFVMILETNWLQQADEHRGRFRSFLLKSLQNFLGHARERKAAVKRGGRLEFVRLENVATAAEPADHLPPEQQFDFRWANAVVDQALDRLREDCETRGRLRLFEVLSTHLGDERSDISYAHLAGSLGVAEAAVKKQLHNLRQRYRSLLREEVAQTVRDPADVDDEIRHLCAVLASAP
jgi:RNA polymerase sigma-70 factor (ECF subfamily)